MQQINDVRDYAIAVCGILANQLHQMAEVLDAATPEVIAGDLYNIAEETGLLDEEACAPLEIEPDESKPGWHRTPEGLVYKSEPTPA